MTVKLLGEYYNGNYHVSIYSDGTKIRETSDHEFIPSFAESMDLKITNKCDKQCPWCHENSLPNGKHGDIDSPFLSTLPPFTEVAIGGGNPLEHPRLEALLQRLKENNVIANMTVNQDHFMADQQRLRRLVDSDLIKGLGVSLTQISEEFLALVRTYPNAVVHVINGIVTRRELASLRGLKVLILGYKDLRRGHTYLSDEVIAQMKMLHDHLLDVLPIFKIVSFDNLAIEQLEIQRFLRPEEWERFYMGDDGQFTMYVDLVEEEFAASSTSSKRFALMDDVHKMFEVVRQAESSEEVVV